MLGFVDPRDMGYQPSSTNMSSTSGFDWGGFTTNVMGLIPNIISASKGNPYASTPYGQSSFGTGGYGTQQGVYAGGSFLGASGSGQMSGTTLLLIGLGIVLLLRRK